jgi:hypothetical protein
MPNPAEDPVGFVIQAALNPEDPTLPATREGVEVLTAEIGRIDARRERLIRARDSIKKRLKPPS